MLTEIKKVCVGDLIAGISVAALLIPQSIAYAALLDLPAIIGIYAAILPPIVAAFFVSSPYLQTGPRRDYLFTVSRRPQFNQLTHRGGLHWTCSLVSHTGWSGANSNRLLTWWLCCVPDVSSCYFRLHCCRCFINYLHTNTHFFRCFSGHDRNYTGRRSGLLARQNNGPCKH